MILLSASANPSSAYRYSLVQFCPLALCSDRISSSSSFKWSISFCRVARRWSCYLPRLMSSSSASPPSLIELSPLLTRDPPVPFRSCLCLATLIGLQTATRSLYLLRLSSNLSLTAWLSSSIWKYCWRLVLRAALVVLRAASSWLVRWRERSSYCSSEYLLEAEDLSCS